jgi:hypothetical protein
MEIPPLVHAVTIPRGIVIVLTVIIRYVLHPVHIVGFGHSNSNGAREFFIGLPDSVTGSLSEHGCLQPCDAEKGKSVETKEGDGYPRQKKTAVCTAVGKGIARG